MNPLLIAPVFDIAKGLLDRWFPDPAQKAKAEAEMYQLMQDSAMKQALAQLEVNAKEAANPSVFVAGWRPFIGWVCGVALAYQFIGRPVLAFGFAAYGKPLPELPGLDSTLWELLFGMLGLGTLRTFEKTKGVSK